MNLLFFCLFDEIKCNCFIGEKVSLQFGCLFSLFCSMILLLLSGVISVRILICSVILFRYI